MAADKSLFAKLLERLKYKIVHFFDESIWLRLLSIVLAIVLWSFVISQDNATRYIDVNNIEVEVMGQPALQARGLAIQEDVSSMLADAVNVRLEGAKSDVLALDRGAVRAVVDLSTITSEGTHTLSVSIEGIDNLSVKRISAGSGVTVTAEQLYTREVPVVAVAKNEPADGFILLGGITPDPAVITVSGTRSDVEKIKAAYVEVDLAGVDDSINAQYEFALTDGDYLPVETGKVELSDTSVILRASIYAVKTVSVQWRASLLGNVADGYSITNVALTPSTITIAGLPQAVAAIDRVFIETVNVNGRTETFSEIKGFISQTGIVWTNYDEVEVTVEIEEDTSTVIVSDLPVHYENAIEGAEVALSSDTITIAVVGPASYMANLDRSSIYAYVNLISSTYGQSVMDVSYRMLDENAPELTFMSATVDVSITDPST